MTRYLDPNNASKAYVRQLDRSRSYSLLQPVYGPGILEILKRNNCMN
ncbi:MAG: hypothetical protein LBF85_08840 [Tannerella sp.]|jgi:hypothetical protein|nr:hypothetical protein [Tannerella sp.]